jgi:hypothetical protein
MMLLPLAALVVLAERRSRTGYRWARRVNAAAARAWRPRSLTISKEARALLVMPLARAGRRQLIRRVSPRVASLQVAVHHADGEARWRSAARRRASRRSPPLRWRPPVQPTATVRVGLALALVAGEREAEEPPGVVEELGGVGVARARGRPRWGGSRGARGAPGHGAGCRESARRRPRRRRRACRICSQTTGGAVAHPGELPDAGPSMPPRCCAAGRAPRGWWCR